MIRTEDLKHVYMKGSPFEKEALKGINLQIKDGEFVGLIGHTGSGKSTLIQHFNSLLKPTSGAIYIDGKNITVKGVNLKELRQKVGLVFQYPEHQLFEETLYKDIAFGPLNMGLTDKQIEKRVYEAIDTVGLDEKILSVSPFELSGGQKRRAAIAGVLALKPKILILDEPTAGLDPAGRDEILGQISKFHKELNMTIILVSHSMEEVAQFVDRLIVMNNGNIEMDGIPSEIFLMADRLEEIGLSAPQITYVIKKLKQLGMPIREDIFTVEKAIAELHKVLEARK